jgi:hypothetical protein
MTWIREPRPRALATRFSQRTHVTHESGGDDAEPDDQTADSSRGPRRTVAGANVLGMDFVERRQKPTLPRFAGQTAAQPTRKA